MFAVVLEARAFDDMRNPAPFITASASSARGALARRDRAREDDDAVLEYWARVRAGVEPAPRPGAEAKRNKRLCAHLESHLDDVLAHAGAGGADEGRSRLANEAATALEVGEHLAHDDVMELKRRAREQRGEALSAREVARLKSLAGGRTRREASPEAAYASPEAAYAMPEAPAGEVFEEFDDDEDDEGEFFEYGRSELPRHMRDWYEPPASEYGSFVENQPAAGATTSLDEQKYATVRNLRSHALW